MNYIKLKDWMIKSVADTAYNQGKALANRQIISSYERHHYVNSSWATLPDFVTSLSIEDHRLLSALAKKAFRNGFRTEVK